MFVMRILLAIGVAAMLAAGQQPEANYDEAKVPHYTLPDPLKMQDGTPVTSVKMWNERRRPELLKLFEENIYGRSPARPRKVFADTITATAPALGGKAIRKQVHVHFTDAKSPGMDVLLYLPANHKGPVPVFVSLNFGGNQIVNADPAIRLTRSWVAAGDHRATEQSRGSGESRWPIEQIVARGYAVATAYYGDIEPDFDGGMGQGVRALFPKPGPGDWGAIAAWSWGLSRMADWLETDPDVDAKRMIVVGHSRLGKAAVWAGANDTRFAMVISNCSGEGGYALSRRKFGEQVKDLNTRFPHWFASNYRQYNDREEALPVDMHELVALAAPRPVSAASASEDLWADPKGESLALEAAKPVYELFGQVRVGYHVRPGKHDIMLYDWERFMSSETAGCASLLSGICLYRGQAPLDPDMWLACDGDVWFADHTQASGSI